MMSKNNILGTTLSEYAYIYIICKCISHIVIIYKNYSLHIYMIAA